MKILFSFILIFISSLLLAQGKINNEVDSLKSLLKKDLETKERIAVLHSLATTLIRTDTSLSTKYAREALELSRENNYLDGEVDALEFFARKYTEIGDLDTALHLLNSILLKQDEIENKQRVGNIYISRGNIFDIKGDYTSALESYLKGEEYFVETGFDRGVGMANLGIGNIYHATERFDQAAIRYKKSMRYLEKINDPYLSWPINNLATSLQNLGKLDSAEYYFKVSLKMKEENGDVYGASYTYSDIAELYVEMERIDEAEVNLRKALELKLQVEGISKETIGFALIRLGEIQMIRKKYTEAVSNLREGLKFAEESASMEAIIFGNKHLSKALYETGNSKEAYEKLLMYTTLQDSISKVKSSNALAEMQTKYETKEKEVELNKTKRQSELNKLKAAKAESESERKNTLIYGAFAIAFLLLIGVGFAIRSIQLRKKNNEILRTKNTEITLQKEIVEEKNKEITDSITYAKRIQAAILPSDSSLKKHLPNSFVLYKPKDIVAGDFYWMEIISTNDCSPPFQGGVREAGGGFVSGKPKMNLEHLSEKRKNLRSSMTQAEAFLWDKLKNSQFEGRKFRRQHSIDNYIVDFYCASEKLVIELDGEVHNIEEHTKADQERDQRLKQYGITVLRFENHLVFDNYELVADRIREHFRNSTIDRHSDHPDLVSSATPPSKGGEQSMVLLAAADCTGHGVPGAMVSVVCNNGLNRSVREYGLTDPGQILDKTRELVIQEFEKSEQEVKDGMDIALVALAQNEKQNENDDPHSQHSFSLCFAGAHNSLWIIRKGKTEIEKLKAEFSAETSDRISISEGKEHLLIEVKADKQPIGKFSHPTPFQTLKLELYKGDSIYIFSDGYADQFGGEKGKKFKSSNLKKLLLSIQDLSMDQQKEKLDKTFEEWRGEQEQLDDVCVIGVKL